MDQGTVSAPGRGDGGTGGTGRKVRGAGCAGAEVEFDPDEAELCGAFREDALDEEDAIEAALDQEI